MGKLSALQSLQARLEKMRGGATFAAYARTIGIAPKVLLELLKGEAGLAQQTPKALAGRAESIGRIVDFANQGNEQPAIDPYDVLRDLGLNTNDPNVRQGLARRQHIIRARQEYTTHGDPVITRILFGEGRTRPPNRVLSGAVAPQFPFCPSKTDIERSFAGRFLRRLLGCLQPGKWDVAPVASLTFSQLFDIDELRDGQIDIAFGLFDTPSRRLDGFDFVHVPGIGAPLMSFTFGIEELHWSEFLDADSHKPGEYDVVVIHGEVGDILVSGSCDYPEECIEKLDPNESPSEIAENLIPRALALFRASNDETSSRSYRPFVFCAGMAVADEFRRELDKKLLQKKVAHQDLRKIYRPCGGSKDLSPLYPIYKVSMAVSSVAPRWRDILQDAVVSELFVNGRAITAKQYVDLFLLDSSVEMIPLVPDLPQDVAKLFVMAFKGEIARQIMALDHRIKSKIGTTTSLRDDIDRKKSLEELLSCAKNRWGEQPWINN